MESQRITLRIPPKLYVACCLASGPLSVGEWLRGLAEAATGVKAVMLEGLAGVSPKRRRQIARMGGKAKGRAVWTGEGS